MPNLAKKLLLLSTGAAATPSEPLVLVASNQLFNWFAGDGYSIPSTLEEDNAGGYKQATDNAPIKRFTDTVASVQQEQATLANRLIIHKGGFGSGGKSRNYLEADGGDSMQAVVASGLTGTNNLPAFTIYVVASTSSSTTAFVMYSESNSGAANPFVAFHMNLATAGNFRAGLRMDDGTGLPQTPTTSQTLNDGNPHLFIFEWTGSVVNLYKDSTSAALVTSGSFNPAGKAITINRINLANTFVGRLALWYGHLGTRNATDRTTILSYYGIS